MAAILGRDARVYFETPDGVVFDMTGKVVNMTIEQTNNLLSLTHGEYVDVRDYGAKMTFTVVGSGEWTNSLLKAEEVRHKSTAAEWKCDFCASVNQRRDEKCKSCGASRSFLYG